MTHCKNLNLNGGSGIDEKSFNSGCILKAGPISCVNKLDMDLREKKSRMTLKVFSICKDRVAFCRDTV